MSRVLLLSGGAFRGAVQVPVIEKLFEQHEYDAIYGVSVGSINGAMMAQHDLKRLRGIWDSVDGVESFLKAKWYWPFDGYYDMLPLRQKLVKNLSLERIKVPFRAGAVSGTTGEYFNLRTEDMTRDEQYVDAVQASSCQAGIMIPGTFVHESKTHLGFDGGYRNIIPVQDEEFEHADIVACTPIDRMKMKGEFQKTAALPMLLRGIGIFQDEIFDKDISSIEAAALKSVTVYAPQENPGESFDASREVIQFRYRLGEEALLKPHKIK